MKEVDIYVEQSCELNIDIENGVLLKLRMIVMKMMTQRTFPKMMRPHMMRL